MMSYLEKNIKNINRIPKNIFCSSTNNINKQIVNFSHSNTIQELTYFFVVPQILYSATKSEHCFNSLYLISNHFIAAQPALKNDVCYASVSKIYSIYTEHNLDCDKNSVMTELMPVHARINAGI